MSRSTSPGKSAAQAAEIHSPKATIWTLQVKLGQWQATLEIDSSASLYSLHNAIQRAVGFDSDHLFEFYVARTERSRRDTEFYDGKAAAVS